MSHIQIQCRDRHEFRALISGLRRLEGDLLGQIRRDEKRGWKPEAGHMSANAVRLKTVRGLLKRYGNNTTGS